MKSLESIFSNSVIIDSASPGISGEILWPARPLARSILPPPERACWVAILTDLTLAISINGERVIAIGKTMQLEHEIKRPSELPDCFCRRFRSWILTSGTIRGTSGCKRCICA